MITCPNAEYGPDGVKCKICKDHRFECHRSCSMYADDLEDKYGYLYLKCTHPDNEPNCDEECYKCDWAEVDWEMMNKVSEDNKRINKFYERKEMLRIKVLQNLINVLETYRCKYNVENRDGFQTMVCCDNVYFVFNGDDLYIDGERLEYETLKMTVESEDNVIHITFDDDVNETMEVNIYDRRG